LGFCFRAECASDVEGSRRRIAADAGTQARLDHQYGQRRRLAHHQLAANGGDTLLHFGQASNSAQLGQLCDLAPTVRLPVALYWHCWKLESVLLQSLTDALRRGATAALAH
jgi:hypothetical protein